jgi:hypothetical protein
LLKLPAANGRESSILREPSLFSSLTNPAESCGNALVPGFFYFFLAVFFLVAFFTAFFFVMPPHLVPQAIVPHPLSLMGL